MCHDEPYLFDSVGHVLVVSSTPLAPTILPLFFLQFAWFCVVQIMNLQGVRKVLIIGVEPLVIPQLGRCLLTKHED